MAHLIIMSRIYHLNLLFEICSENCDVAGRQRKVPGKTKETFKLLKQV